MESSTVNSKSEGLLSRMALNDNKAGMEGLDRDKINKIIIESSKGSRFYENELKREQQVNQRIEKMMLQKAQITEQQLKKAQDQLDRVVTELEKSRDLTRVIVHVDMDAFYAAVEMRDCPELKDQPMAVGSMSMLSTSNYHARRFGVRAAMPGFIAKKLCPDLIIVPLNFDKYRAVSKEIRDIFADYDPHFMPMSLDEAYLDFTDHLKQRQNWPESFRTHHYRSSSTATVEEKIEVPQEADLSPVLFEDSPNSSLCLPGPEQVNASSGAFEVFGLSIEEAVREMRFRIEQKTMLTASAGIGPNMMLSKVCSDKNKPNGQYRLPSTRDAVMEFVQDLPVRKVCGIGKVSEKMLNALDVTTCSHLGQKMALLSLLFSETAWHHFAEVSLGLGSVYVPRHEERKSMSTERTFRELSKAEEQLSLCRELCEDLANDLKKEDLKGKTVTLKLKNVNFEVKTRALTLAYPVATAEEIFAVAKDLLKTERDNESPQPLRLRLMGVRISAFVSSDDKKPQQRSIIGFLQHGKTDSEDVIPISQKHEKDHLRNHSVQTRPLACLEPVQSGQKPEEVPLWRKQKRSEGEKTDEEPQQSFFQRAHARRLKLKEINERESEDNATSAELPTDPQQSDSSTADLPEDQRCPPHAEAAASTSGCGSKVSESLGCPVCFRSVETNDLNVFNRHIDQCLLRDASENPSKCTGSDAESDLDQENDHRQSELMERLGGVTAEVSDSTRVNHKEDPPILTNGPHTSALFINDADRTSQNVKTCGSKGHVLICPICQLSQDNNDLIMFNQHVDLCLNQEALNELEGEKSSCTNPPSVTSNRPFDRGHLLPAQGSKGKSKRRHPPSSPPSKRAKGTCPHNTIDRFLRGHPAQEVHPHFKRP
ncbi:DNA polymerase kappa isoform X2 [Nelusetta ayraudi]|uniref:DNA polymerase kappa isoform X2 n=1 Tax=Nelusetta ayraudi TaxID=303726 RepID=UPI003F71F0B3